MRNLIVLIALLFLNSAALGQESPSVQLTQDLQNHKESERIADEDVEIEVDAAQLQLIVNVQIAAKAAGAIDKISIAEGDEVKQGDPLAVLDREEALATANAARSDLAISQEESKNDVDLKYAHVSKEVSSKVYQRSVNANRQFAKAVSKTELERLKLEYERAKLSGEQAERSSVINELKVEQKKSQLDLACVQLKNREIQSPVSGVVVQVYQQAGEWVQPGQPIARVIVLEKLRVTCRCYLEKASPEQVSEDAVFRYGGKEFKAKVVFASPEVDPDLQDFAVFAEVDNPDGKLKPGMNGTIILKARK